MHDDILFVCMNKSTWFCVHRALSQKWNMPLELATDLAQLALYDIVIYAGADS